MRKCITTILLLLFVFCGSVHAQTSYTYSTKTGKPVAVPSPMPMNCEQIMDGEDLGVILKQPKDIEFDSRGNMYIVDMGNNAVYVFNQKNQLIQTYTEYEYNGKTMRFNSPTGIAITAKDEIYVCDTNNGNIVVFQNGVLKRVYNKPESSVLGAQYVFKPQKIVVDTTGNMYVINADEYQGLIQMDPDGNFITFMGSDKVTVDPFQLILKKIMSDKQAENLLSFVPVEYFSIAIDQDNFIYAVSAVSGTEPIKKLNLSGDDILNRNGYVDIVGDINVENDDTFKDSLFVDITFDNKGNYYVLDSVRGRIFCYNYDGYLLFAFGDLGEDMGEFISPGAMTYHNDKLYVTDLGDGSISVFTFNEYGQMIIEADENYTKGNFDESFNGFQKVLLYNANLEFAHTQLGKIYLVRQDYKNALISFENGNYRGSEVTQMDGYNKAYTELRKVQANQVVPILFCALLTIYLVYKFVKSYRKRRAKR